MQRGKAPMRVTPVHATVMAPIASPVAVNHLFLARTLTKHHKHNSDSRRARNRTVLQAPTIASLYDDTSAAEHHPPPQSPSRLNIAPNIRNKRQSRGAVQDASAGSSTSWAGMEPKDRSMSVQSIESEVSATCSTSLSHRDSVSVRSDSTSDVSTVCGGDDVSDTQQDGVDTAVLCDKEINRETGETDISISMTSSCDDTSVVCDDTNTVDDTSGVCDASSQAISGSRTDDSEQKENCDSRNDSDGNIVAMTDTAQVDTTHDVTTPDDSDVVSDISKQSLQQRLVAETALCKDKDYYKENQSSTPFMALTHHHVYPRQPADDTSDDESLASSCDSPPYDRSPLHACASPDNTTPAKQVYYPFPSQHISRRRAQNGVKLGLYSADNVPKLELGILRSRPLQAIGRQQINACLHRQYMAEVKKKVK